MERGCSWIDATEEREKRVVQETAARQRGQTGGLGNCQEMLIPIEDGKTERCGGLLPRRSAPGEDLAAAEPLLRSGRTAIEEHLSRQDSGPPFIRRGMPVASAEVFQNRHLGGGRTQGFAVGVALIQAHPSLPPHHVG